MSDDNFYLPPNINEDIFLNHIQLKGENAAKGAGRI
jgi:hypothetical protein